MVIRMREKEDIRYTQRDLIKDILVTIVVVGIIFIYWLAYLFLFSIILVNIWKTNIEQILWISTVLTIVSSIIYILWKVRKRMKVS